MTSDIRLQKNKFEPGRELASDVARLEQRVVLNSTWKFPPAFIGSIPGQSGPRILTSRAYGEAQRAVDKAFANFAGSLAKVQRNLDAGKITGTQAADMIGISGPTYGPNSLLGKLETSLRAAEAKVPYGRGVSIAPVSGTALGVGLSDFSATGANLSSFGPGVGVPTYLQTQLALGFGTAANTEINELVQWTRQFSLRFNGTTAEPNWSWGGSFSIPAQQFGILPGYVAQFGSSFPFSSRDFGTKNT